jgi:hypothetical protein
MTAMTDDYLRQRAGRASRASYDAALAEMPDLEPHPHDRLEDAAAMLDAAEERALAEEGLAADFEAWPEYASGACEDLDSRSEGENREVTAGLDEIRGREGSSVETAVRRAQRQSLDPDA